MEKVGVSILSAGIFQLSETVWLLFQIRRDRGTHLTRDQIGALVTHGLHVSAECLTTIINTLPDPITLTMILRAPPEYIRHAVIHRHSATEENEGALFLLKIILGPRSIRIRRLVALIILDDATTTEIIDGLSTVPKETLTKALTQLINKAGGIFIVAKRFFLSFSKFRKGVEGGGQLECIIL
ncbi:uncharacterized protein BcabD6B2_46720 [Babesia caballi]|uniref:Uncharacterized protein n=1 Tax=Babesia caballi TaxID=5871 RepID=A0AAV4LZK5_BABCB|nr:hypothetical protein BcabD6B2_46720 [Babesia caballi]